MIERFFHWLIGFAEFEICGDYARFLNMTARSGFSLWGFSKSEDAARACCRARDYRRLRPLAHRCGVRLCCKRKCGLPFYVRLALRRKGMVVGSACAAAIYVFLGSFVWGISVKGTQTLTDRAVMDSAGSNGVYIGAAKSSFVPRLSARGIISDLPELKWAAVNTDGCFVEIAVSESAETPGITDDTKWSNIVAAKAGKILAIEAEHGRPEVAIGDIVAEGDLLISGLYQEKTDPYAPVPDDPYQSLGAARGRVIAETYREFTVQVSPIKRVQRLTGEKKTNSLLNVFGLRLPLGLNTTPQKDCQTYSRVHTLTALGTELPISLERDIYRFTEEYDKTLSEEEQKQEAVFKLREAQRAALPEKGKILSEQLDFNFSQEGCTLTAKCRCEEEIALLLEISVNHTGFE